MTRRVNRIHLSESMNSCSPQFPEKHQATDIPQWMSVAQSSPKLGTFSAIPAIRCQGAVDSSLSQIVRNLGLEHIYFLYICVCVCYIIVLLLLPCLSWLSGSILIYNNGHHRIRTTIDVIAWIPNKQLLWVFTCFYITKPGQPILLNGLCRLGFIIYRYISCLCFE